MTEQEIMKVLLNSNEVIGLAHMDKMPDDNYTVIAANVKNHNVSFVVLDGDYNINDLQPDQDKEFISNVINTFILYLMEQNSKPKTIYKH